MQNTCAKDKVAPATKHLHVHKVLATYAKNNYAFDELCFHQGKKTIIEKIIMQFQLNDLAPDT